RFGAPRDVLSFLHDALPISAARGDDDADPVLRSGPIEVDTRTRRVTVAGAEVDLTRKEFDLLALLARDPGATRTRDEILEEVWEDRKSTRLNSSHVKISYAV